MQKPLKVTATLLSALALAACGAPTDTNKGEDTSKEVSQEKETEEEVEKEIEVTDDVEVTETVKDKKDLLKEGESATIDDATMTIVKTSFTDERNSFADEKPDKVMLIEYEVENNGEDDLIVGLDFDVYVDGKKSSSYPNENTMTTISPGRSIEGTAHYGINGDEIEVEWQPSLSFADERAVWIVSPK